MQSKAATVNEYLASLPPDRRQALQTVREAILKNLDKDFAEGMQYGMIGYYVPHSIYPPGYHCDPKQPLPYAGLASQKNHMAVYLMCCYGNEKELKLLHDGFKKAGKKLDMGKSCIRFKKIDDLPVEVIGQAIKRVPAKKWIAIYESAIKSNTAKAADRKAAKAKAKKTPKKK